MHETPLSDAHRAAQVPLVPFKGALVPLAFGPLADALAAARDGAVADLAWLGHVRVTGRHRARFLHAMSTCQVKELAVGRSNIGLFLEGKGRLVAQFVVDAEPDALRLELAREDAERTIAQVLRYRVADLVDFAPLEGLSVLAVVGARAAALLGAAGAELPTAPRGFVDTQVGGVAARVREHGDRVGLPGFDVTVASADAPVAWGALREAGAAPLGLEAWDALRVAGGYPVDGVDVDDTLVPLESAQLARAIDWQKGCYLGQEVVCMMNDRGQPTRQLCAVTLPEGARDAYPPGTVLAAADDPTKPVGRLGTVALLPNEAAPVGLAVIKRKHTAPETALLLPDGRAVRVRALPVSA